MDYIQTNASVGETTETGNNVCSAVEKAKIEDAYLNAECGALKQDVAVMIKGTGTAKGKELSEALDTADGVRDRFLSALIHLLKGFILLEEDPISPAAGLLMKIVDDHGGNFSRLPLEKESATYDSLLEKFEAPEAVAAFATLGLATLPGRMKTAETNFKQLYQQSAEIESGKTTVSPSSVKRSAQRKLNGIVDYLNAMSRSNPAVYGALAANVAELIDTVNNKVKVRASNAKKESAKTKTEN